MRKVVFHFHLFKNAGTSIDTILSTNFSNKIPYKEFEFYPYKKNVKLVIDWICSEKDVIAFSSHTARCFNFKILEKNDIEIFPIIFIRHPIVRIASVYRFEKTQQLDTLGTTIARNTDMKGYIDIRCHLPQDYQCRNFHVMRLSDLFYHHEESNFNKAMKALDTLPFVGLVEEFEKSIKLLESKLKEFGLEFKSFVVYKNVTNDIKKSLDERLAAIEEELGKDFYNKVVEINREDLMLWEEVKRRYDNLELG